MSITAAGLYGLSLEKMLIDTLGQSLEAETHEAVLVSDTYTPAFDTHDFFDDLTNVLTGTPDTVTTTEVTISSGTLMYDRADDVYSAVTVTDAMANVTYTNVGAATTDQLICLQDFVTAASASAADFTVQHAAGGVFDWDFTP